MRVYSQKISEAHPILSKDNKNQTNCGFLNRTIPLKPDEQPQTCRDFVMAESMGESDSQSPFHFIDLEFP